MWPAQHFNSRSYALKARMLATGLSKNYYGMKGFEYKSRE